MLKTETLTDLDREKILAVLQAECESGETWVELHAWRPGPDLDESFEVVLRILRGLVDEPEP